MNRHLERGFLLVELKRFADAAAEFAKACVGAGSGGSDPIAHAALALLAVHQDRLSEARRHLRQARRLHADHPVVHLAAAALALRSNRFAEARTCMRAALRHEPNDAELLGLAALAETAAGADAEAIAFAEHALAIDPTHVTSLECCVIASHRRQDETAFPVYLARLRQAAPQSTIPSELLAGDALFDDHLELAQKYTNEGLRLDPQALGSHQLRLRCTALAHPIFQLCQGRISSWRAPVWLRILICFVPMLCLVVVGIVFDLQTPRWLNVLCMPFVPVALAFSVLLGWPSWLLIAHALRDKFARKILRFARVFILIPAILTGALAASQAVLVATGGTVAVGGIGFLSILLLCVWTLGTNRTDLRVLTPDRQAWLVGGAFFGGLLAQIAANTGSAAWPGKALWALNLAALGTMFLLTLKTPPTQSLSKRTAVA